jgi:hypothetical protein
MIFDLTEEIEDEINSRIDKLIVNWSEIDEVNMKFILDKVIQFYRAHGSIPKISLTWPE